MILIVDDEPIIRALLEVVLQQAGFRVMTAGCGGDAIAISQSHQGEIELLITDISLPGMNGWTLARTLVEDEPDLAVLFMSGGCDAAELDQCGRSEFLAKPFSLVRLLAEVRNLMCQESVHGVS
jgi:DNA-binding response OmpR family regulator